MKTNNTQKYIWIFLQIALLVISTVVAAFTYRYTVIVRGVSSLVLLYLLFHYFTHSDDIFSLDDLKLHPHKLRFIVSALILAVVGYWSGGAIVVMFFSFLKWVKNFL